MAKTETIRWEDAAVEVTATGWACRKCGRFFGPEERMARYCCGHRNRPCETQGCDGRASSPYLVCSTCRARKEDERWAGLPRVEWDGKTPLCLWDDDRYFFDEDDLSDYMAEREITPEQIRLVLCKPVKPPEFDVLEFLDDCLPSEWERGDFPGAEEISDAVNAWAREHVRTWEPSGTAISVESIRKVVRHDG